MRDTIESDFPRHCSPEEKEALRYHRYPRPGKVTLLPSKPLKTQHDLALAYSPGVGVPASVIAKDPDAIFAYTNRGNLVGIVSNGTAVLGLGDVGPLAAKPVLEGKAVLLKKFSDIDTYDLELDTKDVKSFVSAVKLLEPSFGGIILEDIKAPECFAIEEALQESMNIPVFHDDQHGTAVVVGAAVTNGLLLANKSIADAKLVCSGAGAAALACLRILLKLGLKKEHVWLFDSKGLVTRERSSNSHKDLFARKGRPISLREALRDADIFLGLSAPNVLTGEDIMPMGKTPLLLALANPVPEIDPIEARRARPDCIVATGRSDYPNQVNNVLCFPFLFRGALDVRARKISDGMQIAVIEALADLARTPPPPQLLDIYERWNVSFGSEYIVPLPLDHRLQETIAPRVAEEAMRTGLARRTIDIQKYKAQLKQQASARLSVLRPLFMKATLRKAKVVFTHGEDHLVLGAVPSILGQGTAKPILIGRPKVIKRRMEQQGLTFGLGEDVEIVNPENDDRFDSYWQLYFRLMARRGVSRPLAKFTVRTDPVVIASLMVRRREAEAMVCQDLQGREHALGVIENLLCKGVLSELSILRLRGELVFVLNPLREEGEMTAEELALKVLNATRHVENFGLEPRIALIGRTDFGGDKKSLLNRVLCYINTHAPATLIDGEMSVRLALDPALRSHYVDRSPLGDQRANLLIAPSALATSFLLDMIRESARTEMVIPPTILGSRAPVTILETPVVHRISDTVAYLSAMSDP